MLGTLTQTFRYERWAGNLIKCACSPTAVCGEHITYTTPAGFPCKESHPVFAERLAARRAFQATCDESTVCPAAPVAPSPEPTPEEIKVMDAAFGYTPGEDSDPRQEALEERGDYVSPWEAAMIELEERGYTMRARVGHCSLPYYYGTIIAIEAANEFMVLWDSGRRETVSIDSISPLGYTAPVRRGVTVLDRETGRAAFVPDEEAVDAQVVTVPTWKAEEETVRFHEDERGRQIPVTSRRPGRCGAVSGLDDRRQPCILVAGHAPYDHRNVGGTNWSVSEPDCR